METLRVDALVIGAGPGGYVAGIRLGQLGKKALVVERDKAGGVCLNVGCIPSKALINAAKLYEKIRHGADLGILADNPRVDMAKLQTWKDGLVGKLSAGVRQLLKANGCDWRSGAARLLSPGRVEIQGSGPDAGKACLVEAAHIVIATTNLAGTSATKRVTVVPGIFTSTGNMTTQRSYHTATLLPNGKVLVVGKSSADLYDPATGSFTLAGNVALGMTSGGQHHTATWMPTVGKVLIAGGYNANADLYDPTTGKFTPTGNLTTSRAGHTATWLPRSGTVLIAAGSDSVTFVANAELYDPATGGFTPTGSMITPRQSHTATLLPSSGKVLLAGGQNGGPYLASAELFDPTTGKFTTTSDMNAVRVWATATLLSSSEKVLIAGGYNATAELYDPTTGKFTLTGSMNAARRCNPAILLQSGEVLIVGGYVDAGTTASAEIYDPSLGTFSATAVNMATARGWSTATLLSSGTVLITGGSFSDGTSYSEFASAEVFQ
jgi:hypothetical protein